MRRREFVKSALLVSGGLAAPTVSSFASSYFDGPPQPDAKVRHVFVMFKCHFDAGFINTQAAVVAKYFTEYFPRAIQVASQMRSSGAERYVWTTGSWLLYEYLEQASAADRRNMEQAIARGDIAWHALPFNWQTEMLDRSMIDGSFALSHALDSRFGRKTTGAKMTDVPGHTRGLVAPMAAHGVTFLDIGVNDASTPAEVPPLFNWKDSSGAILTVMYHHGYGGVTVVPGSDIAIAIVVRGDNSGPHTPDEIAKTYSELTARFPNAQITPTSLTEIANAVLPYRKNLPTITQEIGDTWIHGCASDPLKVARYREVARLRQTWIEQGRMRSGDATDLALLRHLLLEAEHTWGTDTKTWLDFDHYTPRDLVSMLGTKNYKVVEFSWEEKRRDLFDGLATLPAVLRSEAFDAVHRLDVKEPQLANAIHVVAGKTIETEHFTLALDAKTGAIQGLLNKRSRRQWASEKHPLALFSYQTLSQQDYATFFSSYVVSSEDWAKKDFGKPNIERFGAESRIWQPALADVEVAEDDRVHRVLARLEIRDAASIQSGVAAFPRKMFLEIELPKAEPVLRLSYYCFDKPATRLPEALWLTFNPIVAGQQGWTMDKSGEKVSPFDVVTSGNRHMHAVTNGFQHTDGKDSFIVETLDAPVIALGEMSPLNFSRTQPELSGGIHSNLFNNAWGTNYIMWYGEDMCFRYVLRA